MRVSKYTLGMWELKSIVVFSNAQRFERGLIIYKRYIEEPHSPQIIALTKKQQLLHLEMSEHIFYLNHSNNVAKIVINHNLILLV